MLTTTRNQSRESANLSNFREWFNQVISWCPNQLVQWSFPKSRIARLGLETLEDRIALANYLWIAEINNATASTPGHWVNTATGAFNVVPATNGDDSLEFNPGKTVFGKTGANKNCTLDYAQPASFKNIVVTSTFSSAIKQQCDITVTNLFDYKPGANSTLENAQGQQVFKLTVKPLQDSTAIANISRIDSSVEIEFAKDVTTKFSGFGPKEFRAYLWNSGAIEWTGGWINIDRDFTNQASGTIDIKCDGTRIDPLAGATNKKLINHGKIIKTVGEENTSTYIAVPFENQGLFVVQAGTLELIDEAKQTNAAAKTDLRSGTTLVNTTYKLEAGLLSGLGTISGSVNNSGGNVRPDRSLGGNAARLKITGDYTQGANGDLQVIVAANGRSLLEVTGTATINGKITFIRDPNFKPGYSSASFLLFNTLTQNYTWRSSPPKDAWLRPQDQKWYAFATPFIPQATPKELHLLVKEIPAVKAKSWLDTNRNGIQNVGEPAVPGVFVSLYDNQNTLVYSTTTDSNGEYNLPAYPGSYFLRFGQPSTYSFAPLDQGSDDAVDSDVNPSTGETAVFTSVDGGSDFDFDVGIFQANPEDPPTLPPPAATGTIGDSVWIDADQDGVKDASEPGLAGVIIKLYDYLGNLVASATTNGTGGYQFTNVKAGSYRMEFILPEGYTFTQEGQDSVADTLFGFTSTFHLAPGQSLTNLDVGLLGVIPSDPEV